MSNEARKTVEDLKAKRAELVEKRVEVAYRLARSNQASRLEELARLQLAITALDAVIAEGRDEPAREPTAQIWMPPNRIG